jgi:hypothetical protein
MIWQFSLIDIDDVATVVEEPIGWDSVTWTAQRNLMHHGIFFNINTGNFNYVGTAFTLLLDEYELRGADGAMQLKVEYQCTPQDEYQLFFLGKFDFNTFKRTCGDECMIECEVIASSCVDKFLNRVDTDISLSTTTDLDGNSITPIVEQTMTIEGQDIILNDAANNFGGVAFDDTNCVLSGGSNPSHLIASYTLPTTTANELGVFNANGNNTTLIQKNITGELPFDNTTSPISITTTDWEDYMQFTSIYEPVGGSLNCLGNIDNTLRFKGELNITAQFNGILRSTIVLKKYSPNDGTFITHGSYTVGVDDRTFTTGITDTASFDIADTNTFVLLEDEIICLFWLFTFSSDAIVSCADIHININYDTVNEFNLTQLSSCEATTTKAYNVNSVFGFLPNILANDCFDITIGNYCLTDYSICNGLQIRNVLNPTPQLFLNWTEYFQNIKKIFNIGWGFRTNETELVIDAIENFYGESVVVDIGSVNKIEFQNSQELNISIINIGYSTWEAEEYTGLDEMNTTRQYRRNVSSFYKPIDLISNYIAAGYTIEITRRKNQALTGTSDWRFDDNIFIINTQNDDVTTVAYRGVDYDPSNIMSPSTRMNYMLTPARNLMRWFKSLCMNPTYTNDEFIFTSGNGNYIAHGKMEQDCSLEETPINENETIISGYFISQDSAKPLWKPMYMTFDCPLTIAQQQAIQADPYGVIKATCNGTDYYGSIISCNYNPNEGMAKFKLLEKIIYG